MSVQSQLLNLVGSPDRAWLAVIAGVALLCREFTAPGRVIPGVLGAVAIAAGVWSLTEYRLNPHGMILLLLSAVALLWTAKSRDPWWKPRWYLRVAGYATMAAAGSRLLIAPPWKISIFVAIATVPVFLLTAFLLNVSAIARRNKVADDSFSSRPATRSR